MYFMQLPSPLKSQLCVITWLQLNSTFVEGKHGLAENLLSSAFKIKASKYSWK